MWRNLLIIRVFILVLLASLPLTAQTYIDQFNQSQPDDLNFQLSSGSGILYDFDDATFLGGTRRLELTRVADTSNQNMFIIGEAGLLTGSLNGNVPTIFDVTYTPGTAFDWSASPILRLVASNDRNTDYSITLDDGTNIQTVTINVPNTFSLWVNVDYSLSSFNTIDLTSIDKMKVSTTNSSSGFDFAYSSISLIPEPATYATVIPATLLLWLLAITRRCPRPLTIPCRSSPYRSE